jgi:site-specific recombinase XerD
MAGAGVAMRTLQEWMGHRDIQTTMRYADYAPSAREAELISAAFDQTAIELHGGETEELFRPHT